MYSGAFEMNLTVSSTNLVPDDVYLGGSILLIFPTFHDVGRRDSHRVGSISMVFGFPTR
jgi:hypothetical protein